MIPTICSGKAEVWSSERLADIRAWGGGTGWIGEAQDFKAMKILCMML